VYRDDSKEKRDWDGGSHEDRAEKVKF
jgi:hypothetical protein